MKVLHVGAHEELVMNYFRNFKSGKIQFDYVLRRGGVDFRFKQDPSFNGRLYYITPMQSSVRSWIKELRFLIRSGNYSHVHLHLGWANIYGLIAGIGLDVKMVAHNHSFYTPKNWVKSLTRVPLRLLINVLCDYKFACSKDAGKQLFYGKYNLLPNAIDYSRFRFSKENRQLIREEFGIGVDAIVIGHVGNFMPVKNQSFLVQVFSEIINLKPNAVLVLVGADYGTLDDVRAQVSHLNLSSRVIFAGDRHDVEKILSALDIFIFPSMFEGFGMALLEAQASGLPCLFSSAIPADAVISSLCVACDLVESPDVWAKKAVDIYDFSLTGYFDRVEMGASLVSRFDVTLASNQLEEFYLKTAKQKNIKG